MGKIHIMIWILKLKVKLKIANDHHRYYLFDPICLS